MDQTHQGNSIISAIKCDLCLHNSIKERLVCDTKKKSRKHFSSPTMIPYNLSECFMRNHHKGGLTLCKRYYTWTCANRKTDYPTDYPNPGPPPPDYPGEYPTGDYDPYY